MFHEEINPYPLTQFFPTLIPIPTKTYWKNDGKHAENKEKKSKQHENQANKRMKGKTLLS